MGMRQVMVKRTFVQLKRFQGSIMPQGYHHLKQEQRCQIYGLKKSKMVQQNIAAELGVSQATIMRRNAGKQGYRYGQAHAKAAGRKYAARGVCRKMTPANII
jgi:IS30 family transposase